MGTMTILFVDQVGSTLQLSTLGDRSAIQIRDELNSLVTQRLGEYGGVYCHDTGDGFMATFDSCVNAVEFALSLHETMIAVNVTRPLERRLVMRMGLHTGEPLVDASGPFGAAVVVAARLCGLAGAGQLLVSDVVRVLLEPRRLFDIVAVGPRRLKGFPEPMMCHLIRPPNAGSETSLPAQLVSARDAPFVGRSAELDRLRVAFFEAAENAPTVVVVAGARGVGKTRLVQEFAAEAHQQGAAVRYARDADGLGLIAAELRKASASPGTNPMVAVVDDIIDIRTIVDIMTMLRNAPPAPLLAVVLTDVSDLDEEVAGAVVVRLADMSAEQVGHLIDVQGISDAESQRDLVATARRTPGAVREELDALDVSLQRNRLRVAIDQAAAGREEEERSLAAVTSGLLALGRTSSTRPLSGRGEVAPYKGLVSYGSDDGPWFCGRDQLTAELVARLAISRFLAVTGGSGSGKSSLLHAGLVAALRTDAIEHSSMWPIVTLTPHATPLFELAQSLIEFGHGDSAAVLGDRLRARPTLLADVAGRMMEDQPTGRRVILVVDQFEEVFTLCRRDDERVAFFDALVHATQVPDGPTTVVLALRGDYYGHCSAHPDLARLLAASHVLVGPMSPSEIRSAIEQPAHRAGLVIDNDLVDRAVDDASGAAGVLPLLSTAMLETWKRRSDHRLLLQAYVSTGGVHGAIARLAESVYERLSVDERRALRTALMRLAELGEDGDDVRRRAPLDEIVTSPTHQDVLDALVSHRLVTVDAGRVEVAHEALLREWPRLRTWLEEDRAGRALHRRLTADARAWDEAGRLDDLLLRGMRLDSALDWAGQRETELHPVERAFLDASAAAWQRELATSRRTARRLRTLAVALAVLLALAIAAGVIAQSQRNQARQRARVAEASRIVQLSEREVEQDLPVAALLAVEAWRTHRTEATEGALLNAANQYGTARELLPLQISGSFDVSAEDLVAAVGFDGRVTLWDLHRREDAGQLDTQAAEVEFSPDGSLLAVFGHADGTRVQLEFWDVRSHESVSKFRLPFDAFQSVEEEFARRLAWIPDGTRAVFAGPGRTDVLDIAAGMTAGRTLPGGKAALITRDGSWLAVFHESAIGVWDAIGLDAHEEIPVAPPAVDDPFAPASLEQGADGTLLLLTDRVQSWDLSTRRPIEHPFGEFANTITVSRNGTKAAVNGAVWDLTTREPIVVLESADPYGQFYRTRFTADGSHLVTPSFSGPAALMPTSAEADRAVPIVRMDGQPEHVAPGSDGRLTIIERKPSADDNELARFEAMIVEPRGPTVVKRTELGSGRTSVVSRDGHTVAVRTVPGETVAARVFDVAAATTLSSVPHDDSGEVGSMALADDGRYLSISGLDGLVRVFESTTGDLVGSWTIEGEGPAVVAFTSDGAVVATRSISGDDQDGWATSIWSAEGRRLKGPTKVEAAAGLLGAHVSEDGRTLLVNTQEGVSVLDVDQTEPWQIPAQSFGEPVKIADAGSGRVSIAQFDGMQMWDLESRLPVGGRLHGAWGATLAVRVDDEQRVLYGFSVHGSTLFMTRRSLDPEELTGTLCDAAARNLTAAEWREFFPRQDYRETCPTDGS